MGAAAGSDGRVCALSRSDGGPGGIPPPAKAAAAAGGGQAAPAGATPTAAGTKTKSVCVEA